MLIGLFGISASTSSQVLARRGEFGMLRHLGVTRGEIGRMLAFEGAALGAVGVVTGLVVGFVVSLILIYVVNRQSFHWTMDVHVPWGLLAVLSGVLVAAAAITSAVSGRQAMGDDVVRAVKEDWWMRAARSLLLARGLRGRARCAPKSPIRRSCRGSSSSSRATRARIPITASSGGTSPAGCRTRRARRSASR